MEIKSHLNALLKKYLGEKIHKISYDTYEREIERYDGDKTPVFEKIFFTTH